MNTRTKLTLTDIYKLTELCLIKSYFLYENKIRLLENAGPIGLSLVVVLSESYLQHLEQKAIAEVPPIQIQPKQNKPYVHDSHARFPSKHQANTFQEILNKQDLAIQCIIEYENGNKSFNFLDINITNTINNKYEFKVHSATYISNQHRAWTLTSSKHQKCIQRFPSEKTLGMFREIYFLIDMFVENGHNKQLLGNLRIQQLKE